MTQSVQTQLILDLLQKPGQQLDTEGNSASVAQKPVKSLVLISQPKAKFYGHLTAHY